MVSAEVNIKEPIEMKVTQLGCGITGLVCAEQLAKNPNVDKLILADFRTDAAEALAKRLKIDKISVEKVNATDMTQIKALLKKTDIIVSSIPWRLNVKVLPAAIEAGKSYVDFGLPFDAPGEHTEKLDKACKDRGITCLTSMGEEPGISDVFIRYAASKLDRADVAHVSDGDTGYVEGQEFFSLWSPVDLLDETSVPAAVFRNGKMEFVPPLSEKIIYDFPEPLGKLPIYRTNHDETYYMPMFTKSLKEADFRIGIDDNFAKAATMLRKMGMLSRDHIDVKGVKVRPIDVVVSNMPSPTALSGKVKGHSGFVAEVIGVKKGKKTRVRVWTIMAHEKAYKLCGSNAGAYLVGVGGAVPTEMLIEGEIKEKGLLVPEQLDFNRYIARLKTKQVVVSEDMATL
jgi:saccharopine dehydrogenase (NAD+, L-lysine-forming)